MNKLRAARTCYSHLAGQLGVAFTEALVERGYLLALETEYKVTPEGEAWLAALGVQMQFAKPCLDGTERRPHLAGKLGGAIAKRLFELGWIERIDDTRAVGVTERGRERFRRELNLNL